MKFILLDQYRLNLDRLCAIYPNENKDKECPYQIVIEYANDHRFVLQYETATERDKNMNAFDLVAGVDK